MDTAEQYLKMCEKAEEIQQQIDWQTGNIVANILTRKSTTVFQWSTEDDIWANYIWLPRQEQLQEMLITPDRDFLEVMDEFYWAWTPYKPTERFPWRSYIEDEDKARMRKDFTSMEQLWLVFVMFELYHKKWCNGEWVKEE